MNPVKRKKRIKALLLLALMAASLLVMPAQAFAQTNGRTVRVGWYESPFNMTDELGRKSGYAYEYQQKIAAYTGWSYEYVNGSWPDLLQMLIDGKIDMMSDVSYTEKRSELMLFSSLSMGAEDYYIYIDPDNNEISADNLSSMNGKKVGINKGSVQETFFKDWAAANGVKAEIIELTILQSEVLEMLHRGELDMIVTPDNYNGDLSVVVPVVKVGASDFYFALSNDSQDLLPELNAAMSRIQSENPYYNLQLSQKYMNTSSMNLFLSAEEQSWLSSHGTIRVGYQDNYLAFCASDKNTGELTGALAEYLRIATDCLENGTLDFEAIAFPTAEAAINAMKNGEVDCVFPSNLTDYDGESQGLLITPALMRTDMSAVIRAEDQKSFSKKDRVTVAVNIGNTNYDMFLLDHFPEWRAIYYQDTPTCLEAIADGQADCLLISNYRYNNISALCRKLNLVTLSTGVEMDYCFAVNRGEIQLYSILSKVAEVVPAASVNSALSFYYTEDAMLSVGQIIGQYKWVIIGTAAAVAALIIFLLLRNSRAEKKAQDEQQLIIATEYDPLTGLYVRSFFDEYAQRMKSANPDKPYDAIVMDIERFHSVNAVNGRSFGDKVLLAVSEELKGFLGDKEGIASHAEADKFALFCEHFDNYQGLLDRLQTRLNSMATKADIKLRMGVMPWQKDMDIHQMFEQALIACNMARGHYDEPMIVVDDDLRKREAYEQRLENDMRRALDKREFVVYYQPKYDIQQETPRLISVEALVRWDHPEYGLLSPGEFVHLFEKNGRIGEIDKFVWEETARQISEWKKKYGVTLPASVNLSRVDVFDSELSRALDALIELYGLKSSDLKLEVTESACTENPLLVINVIERLRAKGYQIEMDDFGSGYSSLHMLSNMPVDVLKMDREFVSNIEYSKKDVRLVDLILGISNELEIPVIAEGVETKEQLDILKEMGCEYVQGFYFSKPLPADEFEDAILAKAVKTGTISQA